LVFLRIVFLYHKIDHGQIYFHDYQNYYVLSYDLRHDQNHDYGHTTYGRGKLDLMASEESIRNARLTCEANPADYDEGFFWRYAYTIDDATHKLTASGIQSNPRRLWKQFKRYSSRPLGMAKLAKRAVMSSRQKSEPKKAIAGSEQ